MSEKYFFILLRWDKTITNPINKTEIFTCSELYKDYKLCNALYRKGLRSKQFCRELRYMGQKCFYYKEEDFEKYMIRQFEEKKKYIKYLKDEGSILYQNYKSDPTIFSLKKLEGHEMENLNEFLTEHK
jgi:hypothetical protein